MKKFEFPKYTEPTLLEIKEPAKVKNKLEEKPMPVDKNKVTVGLKIPKSNFKSLKLNDVELKLYLNLVFKANFGVTSILKEELSSNGVIIGGISSFLMVLDEYVIQVLNATTDYPDYFLKRVKEELKRLSLDQEDLDRKIKCAISALILSFDNIELVNSEIQDDVLNYHEYIANIYEHYKKMDVGTTKKVIEKLGKYEMSITVLQPKEEE
jgi:predicted Zn-dependent peptidase